MKLYNRFRPGLRPNLAGGTYDASPDTLVGWRGGYPHSTLQASIPRRIRRLLLSAFGASVQTPKLIRWLRPDRTATLCLKKFAPLYSVTLSNLNRFSKFLFFWKAYEIGYKSHTTLPISPKARCYTTLKKLKVQIFCRYSAD